MGRPPHRCLGVHGKHCPTLLTTGSRCNPCTKLLYGGAWTAFSKQYRAAHPECAWCGTTQDLTVDHRLTARTDGGYQTLCRACNNRKQHGHTAPPTFS